MRRIGKQKAEEGAEIDLTPMLDVVFIMLIFFIVVASFLKEAGVEVTRPDNNQPDDPNDAVSIVFEVAADGQIYLENRRVDERAVRAVAQRMLIFFIVTSSFVKEPGVELDKPNTKTGGLLDRATIIFAVDQNGDVHYNKEKIPVNKAFQLAEAAKAEAPQANIVIQVDRESPGYVVEELMDTIRPILTAPIGISTDEEA